MKSYYFEMRFDSIYKCTWCIRLMPFLFGVVQLRAYHKLLLFVGPSLIFHFSLRCRPCASACICILCGKKTESAISAVTSKLIAPLKLYSFSIWVNCFSAFTVGKHFYLQNETYYILMLLRMLYLDRVEYTNDEFSNAILRIKLNIVGTIILTWISNKLINVWSSRRSSSSLSLALILFRKWDIWQFWNKQLLCGLF